MAEPIGLASSVVGLVLPVGTLVDKLVKRFKLVSTNRDYLPRLRNQHTQIRGLLDDVGTLFCDPHTCPSLPAAKYFHRTLDHVRSLLRSVDKNTAVSNRVGSTRESSDGAGSSSRPSPNKMRRVCDRVTPFVRAKKNEAELSELESVLDKTYDLLRDLMSNTEICRQFGDIKEVIIGQQKEDVFTPTFILPVLPPRVVLRWEKSAGTMEAKLKKAVLESMKSKRDGEWGVVVGAAGLGGVGKTTALIGVGKEKEVQEWFKDGVYWIPVGKDASEEELVKVLAYMVKGCGGVKSCVSIGESRKLSEAVSGAGRYFDGKRALFLVDDVWMVEGDATGYLGKIRGLLSGCADSRMVMSTRSKEIACEGGRRVEFGPRESQSATAREMLFVSANVKGEDMKAVVEECEEEVREILEFCGGVPLTLGVAGRAIHMMEDGGGCVQSAVRVYAEELRKGTSVVWSEGLGSYPNFRTSVWISLRKVDNVIRKGYPNVLGDGVEVSELYKRFAVVGKQMYVATDMVRRLWGMKSDRDVENMLGRLWDLNLVSRKIGACNERVMGLHDLLIEFCQDEAGEKVSQYHAELLDAYCDSATQRVSSGVSSGSGMFGGSEGLVMRELVRPWWDEEFGRDKYLMVNLVRHLGGGNKVRELGLLLTDARWTMRRLATGGLLGWKEDFTTLLAALPYAANDAEVSVPGIEGEFELVRDVVRDSWGYIVRNSGELGYQVHARLQGMDMGWPARRFLESVLHIGRKPWLRAVTRCWPEPGSTLLTLPLGGRVGSVRMAGRSGVIEVWRDGGRDVVVVDPDSGETIHTLVEKAESYNCAGNANGDVAVTVAENFVRVWDVQTGQQKCALLYRRTDRISGIAVTADGARVVFVSWDGLIRVWDTKKRNAISSVVVSEGNAYLRCMALSADGHVAVVGGRDGMLRCWDCEKGLVLHKTPQSDESLVRCVVMTPGGEVVVSGNDDGTVQFWKVGELPAVTSCLQRHTDVVTCVDVSADAHVIVSGSRDKTIRVWTHGCVTSHVLQGHTGSVIGVSLDPAGEHILSGSVDGTACVWAVGSTTSSAAQERAHKEEVWCLVASADRRWLATGSWDGGVAMWDVRERGMIWKDENQDMGLVTCVAVSAGGEHVASIGWEGDVQVWCGKTGREIWKSTIECNRPEGKVGMTEGGWTVGASLGTIRAWRTKDGCEGGEGMYEGHLYEIRVCAEMVTVETEYGWFRWRVEGDGKMKAVDAVVDEGVSVERWATGKKVRVETEGKRKRCWAGKRDVGLVEVEAGGSAETGEERGNRRGDLELYVDRAAVRIEGGRTLATLPSAVTVRRQRTWWYDRREQVLVTGLFDGSVLWHDVVE